MVYVASRFGQDAPARIAASTQVLTEATETLPGEPMYQSLIPFYPGGVVSGGSSGSILDSRTTKTWEHSPSQMDLSFYVGDDVVIPLYIQDPNNPLIDMSDQNQWQWVAQIRAVAHYKSTLVNDFIVDSRYIAPTPPATLGRTLVQLFLPREDNKYWGEFEWELYSISPFDFSNFTKPSDWPTDEVWPPPDTLRTWLSGTCTILLRTSSTDELLSTGS